MAIRLKVLTLTCSPVNALGRPLLLNRVGYASPYSSKLSLIRLIVLRLSNSSLLIATLSNPVSSIYARI